MQDSGIVILRGSTVASSVDGGEEEEEEETADDDEVDDPDRPVSPCNVTFVGANVNTGKSSMRSKPKTKKVR